MHDCCVSLCCSVCVQVMSLAQGIVHWQPPPTAMAAAAELLGSADGGSINGYGPAEGLPALRTALQQKLADRNGLQGVSEHVSCAGGGVQVVERCML